MVDYRRFQHPGATGFFTVNLAERRGNKRLTDHIGILREAFHRVKGQHPFTMDAVVVLPDHLHCIWTLPPGDSDFSTRWGLIKANFSRQIDKGERFSRAARSEANAVYGNAGFGSI
jgi:putative transposase